MKTNAHHRFHHRLACVSPIGALLALTCILLLAGCCMQEASGTKASNQVAPNAQVPSMTMVSEGEPTPSAGSEDALHPSEPAISPTYEEIRDRVAKKEPGWDSYIDSLKGVHIRGWTGSIMQIYYHRDKEGVELMSIDMDGPNDAAGRFYDAHVVLIFIHTTETRPWEVGQQVAIDAEILRVMDDGMIYIVDPDVTLVVSDK
jgi:hypothetical protein